MEGEAHWKGVRFFLKIYVSENAFQAILKPSFPYFRHSNPRGGTLIFSYIRRLRLFFGVGGQNFEFRYFLGFSEK